MSKAPPPGPKLSPVQQLISPATANGTGNGAGDSSSIPAATDNANVDSRPLVPIGPPAVYQRGTAPIRKMKGIRITDAADQQLDAFAARTHHGAGALVEEAITLYERVYLLADRKGAGVWDALNTWLQDEAQS